MSIQRKRLFIGGGALLLICAVLAVVLAIGDFEPLWPAEPSKSLKTNGKLKVDANHLSDGYFLAACSKTSKKMKMRVIKDGTTLTYDLDNSGAFSVFPLQLGDGSYEISLYENISGKSYSQAGTVRVSVKLSQKDICYLYPNVYVNYNAETAAVDKAAELCEGKNARQAFQTICSFMKNNFVYDFMKATTVSGKTGVMPDIDGCWTKRMGICQDLSAVMCCMLRSQGIPAKMMIGKADKTPHAWVIVILDGEEEFFDPTAAISGIGKVKKYTEERFY